VYVHEAIIYTYIRQEDLVIVLKILLQLFPDCMGIPEVTTVCVKEIDFIIIGVINSYDDTEKVNKLWLCAFTRCLTLKAVKN